MNLNNNTTNLDIFKKMGSISWQTAPSGKEFQYHSIAVNANQGDVGGSNSLWSLKLKSSVLRAPELMKNHRTNTLEVLIQDAENSIHLISATDDTDTVNHLENLTSYYGSPSNQRVSASVDGTDDFHWNFDQKDVFLQVIRDNGKIRSNIKIISKDYIPLLESFKDFENDIY